MNAQSLALGQRATQITLGAHIVELDVVEQNPTQTNARRPPCAHRSLHRLPSPRPARLRIIRLHASPPSISSSRSVRPMPRSMRRLPRRLSTALIPIPPIIS